MHTPIELLRLPERTYNALLYHHIDTLEVLLMYTEKELFGRWQVGDVAIGHIKEALKKRNLTLKP